MEGAIPPRARSPLVDVSDEGLRQIRRWGVLIVIGSFLFGFDTGIISGALLFIGSSSRSGSRWPQPRPAIG